MNALADASPIVTSRSTKRKSTNLEAREVADPDKKLLCVAPTTMTATLVSKRYRGISLLEEQATGRAAMDGELALQIMMMTIVSRLVAGMEVRGFPSNDE